MISAASLRIKVRGGKIPTKRFYTVEGESKAHDLDELKAMIHDRTEKKSGNSILRELIIVLKDDDSAADGSISVKDLEAVARNFGLSVRYDLSR